MGNHEWCERCGENDFHYGKTCEEAYPEKLKARQKKQAEILADQKLAAAALDRLVEKIKAEFDVKVSVEHRTEFGSYKASILFWDAWEAEKKKATV
jgi:ribosomal protein L37E